jgi:hypothetical protein
MEHGLRPAPDFRVCFSWASMTGYWATSCNLGNLRQGRFPVFSFGLRATSGEL